MTVCCVPCRCKELEARCAELEGSGKQLQDQLAAATAEGAALASQRDALDEQLAEARLSVAQLEQQQATFQSVQQVQGEPSKGNACHSAEPPTASILVLGATAERDALDPLV